MTLLEHMRKLVSKKPSLTPEQKEIRKLTKKLQHKDWNVRKDAIIALAKIKNPSTIPHIAQALHDPDSTVKWYAADALARIAHPRAIPHLAKMLRDPDSYSRMNAAGALGRIGREIQGKTAERKEVKALQLVAKHFRSNELEYVVQKAYLAALEGKVTEKNARLYIKQLRAMEGKLK